MAEDLRAFLEGRPLTFAAGPPVPTIGRRTFRLTFPVLAAVAGAVLTSVILAAGIQKANRHTTGPASARGKGHVTYRAPSAGRPGEAGNRSRTDPVLEVDGLAAQRRYDEAIERCRQAIQEAHDPKLKGLLKQRLEWVKGLKADDVP